MKPKAVRIQNVFTLVRAYEGRTEASNESMIDEGKLSMFDEMPLVSCPLVVVPGVNQRLAELLRPLELLGEADVCHHVSAMLHVVPVDGLLDYTPQGCRSDLAVVVGLSMLRQLSLISGSLVLVSSRGSSARRCVAMVFASPCEEASHGPATSGGHVTAFDGGGALLSPLLAFNLGLGTWLDPFLSDPSHPDSTQNADVSAGITTHLRSSASITIQPWNNTFPPGNGPQAPGISGFLPRAASLKIARVGFPQLKLLRAPLAASQGSLPPLAGSSGEEVPETPEAGKEAFNSSETELLISALESYFKSCPR